MVSCPTVASNDVPCSALSVVYRDNGEFDAYRLVRRNPALVLVDTAMVVRAPARLLVSGMGDALATWYEARTCVAGHVPNMRGGGSTAAATALAELCHRTLLSDGVAALAAVRNQAITPALERIVEANTLLSGLGFESSGLAAAHAVHNGLTAVAQTHPYLHGEKVAFGVITQLVLEGARPPRWTPRSDSAEPSDCPSRWPSSGWPTPNGRTSSASHAAPSRRANPSTTSRSPSTPRWCSMPSAPPTHSVAVRRQARRANYRVRATEPRPPSPADVSAWPVSRSAGGT